MSVLAKQSTAITVTVGPILDADGVAVTGAAVSALKISKNGGAPAALNGSATLTHRNTGHYSLALTASDVDTVGTAEIVIDSTTNAMPIKAIQVIEEAVYDALFAASAAGYQVPIWSSAGATVNLSGTTISTSQTITSVSGAVGSVTGAVGSVTGNVGGNVAGSVGSVTGAVGSVTAGVTVTTNNDKTGYSLTATTGLGNQTANITGNLSGSVGSVTNGVTISGTTTTLDALQTALNSAHGAGSWATATGFSTHSAADVWAAATRTLTAFAFTPTPSNAADTTAIKAITDQIVFSVANRVDATATIAAADIRSALGMASADLDTQLDAILALSGSESSGTTFGAAI